MRHLTISAGAWRECLRRPDLGLYSTASHNSNKMNYILRINSRHYVFHTGTQKAEIVR